MEQNIWRNFVVLLVGGLIIAHAQFADAESDDFSSASTETVIER
jgi:hypothetical protein